MLNSTTKKRLRFGVLSSFILIGILLSVGLIGNPIDGSGKTFSLPVFDSFTNVGGTQIDVVCKIKQTLTVADDTGKIITVIESSGIQGSPSFLNIVNPSDNRPVSLFVVQPKISCDVKGADITIERSDLQLRMSVGSSFVTDDLRFQPELKFPATSGGFQTERNLGWFSVTDKELEALISKSDFTSVITFAVTGNVDIHYDKFPTNTMKIPINSGDLKSFWTFKNIDDRVSVVDTDGDGIPDNIDQCRTLKEDYDGYQDADGCPDGTPTTTSTGTTPVTKLSCNTSGKTWYTYTNISSQSCSTAYKLSDGTLCKEWDLTSRSCIDPKGTTTSTTSGKIYTQCIADKGVWVMDSTFKVQSSCKTGLEIVSMMSCGIFDSTTNQCVVNADKVNTVSGCVILSDGKTICPSDAIFTSATGECYQKDMDMCAFEKEKKLGTIVSSGGAGGMDAKIKFQIDIKMSPDGMESFQVADDPTPFDVSIPLNALTGSVSGATKRTAEFKVEPRIVFADSQFHKLVSVDKSNITIEPIVTVKTVDYSLGAKAVQFVKTSGGSVSNIATGLPLGYVTVKSFDIENKIPTSVIPLGKSEGADVRFLVKGTIALIGGDGTFTERIVDVTGADFQITGLTIARADSSGGTDPNPTPNCDPATQNLVTIAGVSSCIPKGTTCDATASCIAPKIGDDNVLICRDGGVLDGGFPCTEDYRIAYCGGADSTDCSKPSASTGDGDIIPPSIIPVDHSSETCPTGGLQSLSLSDNACVIFGGKTGTNSGESTAPPMTTSDPNMIWYIAIGLLGLGVVALAVKRR